MWFIILCSTLPWLAGGVALSMVFANTTQKPGYLWLFLGVGGLLGIIGSALLTIMVTWVGVNLLAPWPLIVLGLVVVASAIRLVQLRSKHSVELNGNTPQLGLMALVSFALISVIAAINAWQVTWVPTTGWDTLWGWAEIAKRFIETTQADPITGWVHNETHPSTVAIVSTWGATQLPNSAGTGASYFPWWLAWLSIVLTVYGYTQALTGNRNTSALVASASATVPLLTNHVLLGGYAEIFLSSAIAGATALLTLSLKEHNRRLALLGLVLALSCTTLKNTGFIFGSCVVLGYLACLAIDRGLGKWLIGLMAVFVVSTGLFVIMVGEHTIAFEIGSRQLTLKLSNAPFIFRNELISLFYNASFSITALLLLAPLIAFGSASGRQKNKELASLSMPWLTSLILLSMLCASQLTDYGFLYAIPGNDTGNSRLSLPLMVCTLLVVGPLLALVAANEHPPTISQVNAKNS